MIESIEWGNLPNIPWIVSDFIAHRGDTHGIFHGDWRDRKTRETVRNNRQKFASEPGLGSAIRQGYGSGDLPESLNRNLQSLDKPDALAIVAGQQVGIFGGPLYTFFKALTTTLMAKALENETSGSVVPIFWMETADADFSEVNRVGFPPNGRRSSEIVYAPRDFVTGQSASFHRLTPEIDKAREQVIDWIKDLPHSQQYIDLLNSSYIPGRTMASAFRDLLTGLFGELGLVVVDPFDPAIVSRTDGFWDECLVDPERINRSFAQASQKILDMGLPLQVRLREDALPILHIDENGLRRRIFGRSDKWKIGREGRSLSNAELLELKSSHPESLSCSALLRPLLQDWLLPTWIYVGGGAELAYHAQIGKTYELLEIPRPLVAPRMSITFVEQPVRRWLDRFNWQVSEVFGGREVLLRQSGRTKVVSDLFDSGEAQIEGWLARISSATDEASVNISMELDRTGRKLHHQWEKLKKTTIEKILERDRTRVTYADKAVKWLMPDGMMQERHHNMLYYLSAYGPQLMRYISNKVDPFKSKHLAIDLVRTQ